MPSQVYAIGLALGMFAAQATAQDLKPTPIWFGGSIQNIPKYERTEQKGLTYAELLKNAKFVKWVALEKDGLPSRGPLETKIIGHFDEEYLTKGEPYYFQEFYKNSPESKNDYDFVIAYMLDKKKGRYEKSIFPVGVVQFEEGITMLEYSFKDRHLITVKRVEASRELGLRILNQTQFDNGSKPDQITFPKKNPTFTNYHVAKIIENGYDLLNMEPDALYSAQVVNSETTEVKSERMFRFKKGSDTTSCSWGAIVYTTTSAEPNENPKMWVDKILYSRKRFIGKYGTSALNSRHFSHISKEVKNEAEYIGVKIGKEETKIVMTKPKEKIEKKEFCVEL